ncbi:hypothetical protein [Algoriphagus faecimaris]|nr:hypothetical protein [Algoriphagus faecimaris]
MIIGNKKSAEISELNLRKSAGISFPADPAEKEVDACRSLKSFAFQLSQRINNRFHLAGMDIVVSEKTLGQRWEHRHTFIPRIPFGVSPHFIRGYSRFKAFSLFRLS